MEKDRRKGLEAEEEDATARRAVAHAEEARDRPRATRVIAPPPEPVKGKPEPAAKGITSAPSKAPAIPPPAPPVAAGTGLVPPAPAGPKRAPPVPNPVSAPGSHATGKAPEMVAPPPTKRSRKPWHLASPPGVPVTVIPPIPADHREIESATIVPERAWIRILLNEVDQSYVYQVIEPTLSADEKRIYSFVRDTLVRTLDGRRAADKSVDWATVLLEAAEDAMRDHHVQIDEAGHERLSYFLVRDFLGYGPIDVLMRDPMIEDISCDGPNIPIYLFHRKYEALRTTITFTEEVELDGFVIRLAQRSGKHISVADPLLDATLPDGSRLQAALGREVTTRGSTFTVRRFRADPLTPPDLIRYGTMSSQMAAYFWFVMEMGASFLMAGGTASGKTTTLNAICQFIPPEKKIVSIEDTREINLLHDNWIAGITRSGFGAETASGKRTGAVDMYKLLEAALRQRPEYLLVGEVRGPEALTLFQAMATGHACYSTMHADAVASAVYRLENEPINVPRMMLQTLDLFLIQGQVRLRDRMARRIREVTELIGFDPDSRELLTNTVFEWDVASDTHRYLGKSYILDQVMEARNLTEQQLASEWGQRVEVIEWMIRNDVRHYAEVAKLVSAYYRDPRATMARIRGK